MVLLMIRPDADGQQDLVLGQRAQDPVDEESSAEWPPNRNMQRDGDDDRDERVDLQQREEEVGRVHPQHQQVAVGEVDDAHHAEDDGQADADEGVDAADQNAADE